jgi:uncharacterized protein
MITDIHTHIFNEANYKDYITKARYEVRVVSLPWYNAAKPGWLDVNQLVQFTHQHPYVFAVGSIDMNDNLPDQLQLHEKLFQQNEIVGIKLYPGYQHFYPSDPRVVAIAKLCQQYNKPLIFHSGDVYDPHQVALMKYAHPLHIDELARACPQTKIVISHFGFPYHLETAMVVSQHPMVFTDISGTIDACGSQEEITALTEQYVADLKRAFSYYPLVKMKTMFATDYLGDDTALNQVEPYIKVIKAIFDEGLQKNAFYQLAERVYFE